MAGPHEHGLGHLDLGGTKGKPNEIHSLPEGSVLAADGSTISWSLAADGTLTATGHNLQLVISRYRPSPTAGTDVLHGGDMFAGTAGPTNADPINAGPKHPGHLAGFVGNLDTGETGKGEDPILGLRFAYSNVGQSDPWLTIRYLTDETEQSAFVEIIGFESSARFLMRGEDDATRVPSKVSATFLPHHQDIKWEGVLDLTESPVKALDRIKGWRLYAFASEFRAAAYFDALSPLLTDVFGRSPTDGLPPGVIAKTAVGIAGRATIWGICGAGAAAVGLALSAPVSVPITIAIVGASFVGGAAASVGSDLWSAATDDIQIIEPEPPDLSDLPVEPEVPEDPGCFAAGTVVALPGRQSVPIENIAVGDLVASRDESSLNEGGKRVTRTWEHPMKRTVDVSLDTGERVRTTSPHRFFTLEEGIVPASELKVGQQLRTLAGPPRTIVGIEPGPPTVTVYNVTVEGFHTYFVGDAALWVHNEKTTSHDDPPPPPPPGGDDGGDDPTPDDGTGGGGGADPVPA